MSTFKRAVTAVLATGLIVLGLGLFKEAQAMNPDTMRMTVSVNPASVGYAVAIASPEVQGYDFGAVDIAATTISTKPIVVTNSGTVLEFFSVGVVDITNTYAWTNNGASLTAGATSYAMQAKFVATGAAQPTDFTAASLNAPSVPPVAGSNKFGQGTNKTVPDDSQDLWLQLKMPTSVEETGVHTLVLTISGQSD